MVKKPQTHKLRNKANVSQYPAIQKDTKDTKEEQHSSTIVFNGLLCGSDSSLPSPLLQKKSSVLSQFND